MENSSTVILLSDADADGNWAIITNQKLLSTTNFAAISEQCLQISKFIILINYYTNPLIMSTCILEDKYFIHFKALFEKYM